MQDAAHLVDTLHIDAQLLLQDFELLVETETLIHLSPIDEIAYFLEYPRSSERGTSHHDGIYAITLEGLLGTLGRRDVAIADDGYMYAWIALHLAYQCPVGLASVHLAAGASVDGQCLYAAVLQLLSQVGDDELFVVPSQSGLHRHRQVDGIHHLARDLQHLRYVLQHAGTSTFASHLLHRTAEVQVYEVGACLLHDACCLDHRVNIASIYLNTYGPLLVADLKLAYRRCHIAHQSLGRHKLGVHHRCAKALA